MRRLISYSFALLLAASAAFAATPTEQEFFDAAREGDRERVQALLDQGVDLEAMDKYGATAVAMAASAGQTEIVKLLIESGAELSRRETFYGMLPVEQALFFAGQRETAILLLAAGAEGREGAIGLAAQNRDLEMLRAIVQGGPINASQLQQVRGMASVTAEMKEILEQARSRPDPPLPTYSIDELHRYTGVYEGHTSDSVVEVVLREGELRVAVDDGPFATFATAGVDSFTSGEAGLRANFQGRAGRIEGLSLIGAGFPIQLRRMVADPVVGALASQAATVAEGETVRTVNWPAFRGSNASGIGDGDEAPTHWDLESGENVLWHAPIPGLGNASPVVWGDHVIVTTAVATGVDQEITTGLTGAPGAVDESVEHSWRVMAFDKRSGELLWDTEVGNAVPLSKRHFKATQANSTPVTNGEHVVVVFPTAGLACLDLDGNVLWKHELGSLNAGAFTDPGIQWGYASSPIIWNDLAILQVDVHGGQYLAAWDLASGEQRWRTEREVAPSWATPSILPGPEGDELIVNGSTIHAYDPTDGRELWSMGPNSELVIATPVVGEDVVYVSAGYPPVKPIYAIKAGTRGDFEVTPGDDHERLAWSHNRGGAYMPTPLLYRGRFYIIHHNGRLVAYESESGTAVHKTRFSKGGTFTGSPVAINGNLYLPTEEGLLYVLSTAPEIEEVAVNDFGEPLMTTLAVSEGVLFARTPSQLIALGTDAGAGAGTAPSSTP